MPASHGSTESTPGARPDASGYTNGRSDAAARPTSRFALPRLTLRRSATNDAPLPGPGTSANVPSDDVAVETARNESWRDVGIFGAGLLLGALLGAGTALLLAPASGFETRTRIVRRAREAGEQAADRLDELGDRVRVGAQRNRRKLERKITMSRWRAQDAWERKRYGAR